MDRPTGTKHDCPSIYYDEHDRAMIADGRPAMPWYCMGERGHDGLHSTGTATTGPVPPRTWTDAEAGHPDDQWTPGRWVNPLPPEPPVGARLGYAELPDAGVQWQRTAKGWRYPGWPRHAGFTWEKVLGQTRAPLVLIDMDGEH